jgi:DNA-3-methyladenine glycosylase II
VRRLPVGAPFHLEATVRVLQRRPTNLIDRWEVQRYRRALRAHGRPLLIEVENSGTIEAPDLRLTVVGPGSSPRPTAAAARMVRQILGLDLDPATPQRLAEAEPALRDTARALRGMRPPRYPDLLETFANVIPFQQVSLEAGMTVVAQLLGRFGEVLEIEGRRHHLFPSAEILAGARERSFRACGMSAHKAHALSTIAKAIAAGDLTAGGLASLPSNEAMQRLMQLAGIGPWSAALVLLRGFRRLDVFPQADTGAEASLAKLLRLRSKASLAPVVERFGDFRGWLYFYGLASRLLDSGLIRPASTPHHTSDIRRRGGSHAA